MTGHLHLPVSIAAHSAYGETGYGFVFSIPKTLLAKFEPNRWLWNERCIPNWDSFSDATEKSASQFTTHCRQRAKKLATQTMWIFLAKRFFYVFDFAYPPLWIVYVHHRVLGKSTIWCNILKLGEASTHHVGKPECLCTTSTWNSVKPYEYRENSS